jgi:hypothetical protein
MQQGYGTSRLQLHQHIFTRAERTLENHIIARDKNILPGMVKPLPILLGKVTGEPGDEDYVI